MHHTVHMHHTCTTHVPHINPAHSQPVQPPPQAYPGPPPPHLHTFPACSHPCTPLPPSPPPHAGDVYLFGKLQLEGRWVSTCVVVHNLHYSLLVVPRPGVFQDSDGEIGRLQAAAAADPTQHIELIKHLQVGQGSGYS